MATRERDACGNNCEVLGMGSETGGEQLRLTPTELKRRELAEDRRRVGENNARQRDTTERRKAKAGSVRPL